MNVMDLIQSFFNSEGAAHLGQSVGLDTQTAQRALGVGLPMQLDALADHASSADGQSQIAEAIQNLPNFGSVQDALDGPDGASNLHRAGELLGPVLLGGRADTITNAVAAQTGAAAGGVGRLMQMALPLLLSLLGGRGGLNSGNIGSMLGGMKGSLGGLGGLPGAAGAGAAALGAARASEAGAAAPTMPAGSAGSVPSMGGPLTADGLLDFMKGQFSGPAAEKIGSSAGFGGSVAGRATMAALPLVLGALVSKAKADTDILGMARPFGALSDDAGHLNTIPLNDPSELGRIEGQGRSLLGSLFGNVDELTGRLGTALGGSGSSAGRLLAVLTPLVLSVLGGWARAGNMDAGGLGGLLGGLGGRLTGLLPAGLGSLGALLGVGGLAAGGMAAGSMAAAATPAVTPAPVTPPSVTMGAGSAARPAVPTVTPAAPATPPPTTERRGGFPLWLIPLLAVLLLGGCWLLNRKPAATDATTGTSTATTDTTTTGTAVTGTDAVGTAATDTTAAGTDTTGTDTTGTDTTGAAATGAMGAMGDGSFMISDPAADATLPAGGFTMKGTGKAGDVLQIMEDGTSLGNVTVAEDGSWSLDVPSPAAGAHTYAVKGADGTELGTLAATVGAADANASAANCTSDYSLSITDGQSVSEPFRFGGKGNGKGYSVTVKRGERTIGVKDVPLDSTCGWSYQSKPGVGAVSYEVRPMGDASAASLSSVKITVNQ
ncbi:DUF937 domain-containing protein [Deinococcus sp.]|uniref:DUF937 domain-containing protein n=1 Tax=Deinococcus sp. TaxID=47478 RepID=UPI002869BC19|nr:DUF937 domain-containing protein [Deinococcus sp.]